MKAALIAVLVPLIAAFHSAPASAQTMPVFLFEWGGFGTASGQFRYPYGCAVGPDGSVIVTDQYNFRVKVFGPAGDLVRSWGSQGTQPGQFGTQIGVATDAQGRVYVADYGNRRVQVFSTTGSFLRVFAVGISAVDVTLGPDGNAYVVGAPLPGPYHGHVYVYDQAGVLLRQFGDLEIPRGVTFAPDGTLWAPDGETRSLVQFDPNTGVQLQSKRMGNVDPSFVSIGGICILDSGVICVCDFDGGKVLMLMPSLDLIGTFGVLGNGPGELASAVDIAPSYDGGFYVVDLKGSKVSRFGAAATAIRTASWGSVKATYR